VGTGSVRRRAQLASARPDLVFAPLRGNIETRLRKQVDEGYDAVVVAVAALERLGLMDHVSEVLDTTVLLPQAAQGALGVECRADDAATLGRLAEIDDAGAHRAVRAERAYLAELGGGCNLPCGALANASVGTDELVLDALLASLDGSIVLRTRVMGSDPLDLGERAARDLLDGKGGRELLDRELA
jgi:hydroxymethylbilane synthase